VRNVVLLALIALIAFPLSGQPPDTVKGGFHKCCIYNYSYTSGILDSNLKCKEDEAIYNEKGIQIDPDTKYDENGNEVEYIMYSHDSIWCKSTTTYKYGVNGNILETDHFNVYGSGYNHYISTFDENGKPLKNTATESDTLNFIQIFKYNDNGKISEVIHQETGQPDRVIEKHSYDKKGNEIECRTWFPGGEPFSKATTKYDKQGNRTVKTCYVYEGCDVGKTTYIFEKGKNRISNAVNESLGGSYQGKAVYNYNEAGILIEEVFYGSDGMIFCAKKYDKYGNIISEIGYDNNVPSSSTEYVYSK